MLFEPIPAQVDLVNSSGRNIVLRNDDKWLAFTIVRDKVEMIPPTGLPFNDLDIYLDATSSHAHRVNLTYAYEIREPGSYQVEANVNYKGHAYNSAPLTIKIVPGAKVWEQKSNFVHPKTGEESVREYELIAHKEIQGNRLLARVRDPKKGQIMCCVPLGNLLGWGEPSAQVDGNGTLHVLNQTGPRNFTYTKTSADGITEPSRHFVSMSSRPNLVLADQEILVVGGDEIGEDGKTLVFVKDPKHPLPAGVAVEGGDSARSSSKISKSASKQPGIKSSDQEKDKDDDEDRAKDKNKDRDED